MYYPNSNDWGSWVGVQETEGRRKMVSENNLYNLKLAPVSNKSTLTRHSTPEQTFPIYRSILLRVASGGVTVDQAGGQWPESREVENKVCTK
jgi:hypothetical protein